MITPSHNPSTPHSFDNFDTTDSKYSLQCMLINIQSICNKVAEFQYLIDKHKPDIIGVTESWCDSKITDAEISLPSYSVYRKDRSTGMGGGVLLYKILNGLVDVSPPICLILNQLATRGHDNKFVHILSRVDAYKFSFFPRIVPLWNKLPDYAISAANFYLFNQYLNCII